MAELAYGRDWCFLGDEDEARASTAGQRPAARPRHSAAHDGPRERASDRGADSAAAPRAPRTPRLARVRRRKGAERGPGPSADRSRGRAFERVLGLLIAAAAISLLGMAAFVFLPGLLRLDEIRVSGQASMTEAEVVEASLLRGGEHFLSIDPAAVERALLAEPRVAEASVERVFPNDLSILIRERLPVAAILVQSEGRDLLVQVDEEGVAFAGAPSARSAAPEAGAAGTAGEAEASGLAARGCLPVLSGMRFEGFSMGSRLPATFKPLLASLARVAAAEPLLLEAFSELKVGKGSFGELELVLYPLHHRIPVRVGPDLNEATLRSIILVLDVLSSRLPAGSVEEIDFRSGKVTYRSKEGMSG